MACQVLTWKSWPARSLHARRRFAGPACPGAFFFAGQRVGQFFSGQLCAVRNASLAERTEPDHPGITRVAIGFDGSGLPDALACHAIECEHGEFGGALLVGFLGDRDFRDLRRLPRHQSRHRHLRHADQK